MKPVRIRASGGLVQALKRYIRYILVKNGEDYDEDYYVRCSGRRQRNPG